MASEVTLCRSVRRHLNALGYHANQSQGDAWLVDEIQQRLFNSPDSYKWMQQIVVWLEDTKIRHYDIDDRKGLKSTDAGVWQEAVEAYLKELHCPISQPVPSGSGVMSVHAFVWLLGYAVGVAYEDCSEDYDTVLTERVIHSGIRPELYEPKTVLPDVDTDDAREAFRRVCDVLGVTTSDEITVEALSRCIYRVQHEIVPMLCRQDEIGFALDDDERMREIIPLGFQTGDEQVDTAARVLRILHIKELRRLQNAIDDAIVSHQEITANPRTETGKRRKKT